MSEHSSSIRVKVRKEYLPFYKDLLKRKIFQEHNEFFTLCCSAGRFKTESLESVPFVELCQAYTFNENQNTLLKSLVYEQYNRVIDGKELFSEAEKLADKGFYYLLTNVFQEYALQNDDGDVSLKPTAEIDFQLALSKYINQTTMEVPF